MKCLRISNLSKSYRNRRVVKSVNIDVKQGEIIGLLGPNGAGKTTFINLLTGALRPSAGSVYLAGHDITGMPQDQRVKLGIARTFQINTLFNGLSVIENLYLAVSERMGVATKMMQPAGKNQGVLNEALRLLQVFELSEDAVTKVQELPYGRQRLVEIAIALALDPKVLLLDEPAAGVPEAETQLILDAIDDLPKEIAVLIIEHDMDVVFRFAKRITVLVRGSVLAEGTPSHIAADREVQAVYLGEAKHV